MPVPADPAASALLAVLGRGVIPAGTGVIRADDAGVTRGDGCFEGCRIVDGTVDKLERHLARLQRSAAAMDLDCDVTAWRALIEDALTAWTEPGEAALKLVLTRGPAGGRASGFLWITPLSPDIPALRRDGLRVVTLDRGVHSGAHADAPWLLGGVKTLSYAVNMAAQRAAETRGADDVLFVSSDGVVLEAPTASVVWSVGRTLHTTPTGATGILAGTTQELLFERAAGAGWQTAYTLGSVADLHDADVVWLISGVRGPVDVVELDGRRRDRNATVDAEIRALCGF